MGMDKEITLYYNEYRLNALCAHLAEQGCNLIQELDNALDSLYEQFVPANERKETEAFIEKQEREEAERMEAQRRFAVFHVCENGSDAYFTSEHFLSFRAAAYRYRLYQRGELDAEPQCLTDAFIGNDAITAADYEALCDRMPNDFRITMLVDFDLENETFSVCDSGDNAWRSYKLHDISVAAFKAFRGDYYSTEQRERIFQSALAGKEIDIEDELPSEAETPTMQM